MEKINLASITEIIVYLGTPALVFSALAGKALVAEDIVLLFVGSTLIFAALGLLIGVYFVLSGFHSRGFALPILFMNAGNMGIPWRCLHSVPPQCSVRRCCTSSLRSCSTRSAFIS
jgi:predicted permease